MHMRCNKPALKCIGVAWVLSQARLRAILHLGPASDSPKHGGRQFRWRAIRNEAFNLLIDPRDDTGRDIARYGLERYRLLRDECGAD